MEPVTHSSQAVPEPLLEVPEFVSVRSDACLVDQVFLMACALRCGTLPCTLKKVEKNRDLLTRPIIAQLKSLGYEEDEEGNLFKIKEASDGITQALEIRRSEVGGVTPWGVAFYPYGSGFFDAEKDLLLAIEQAQVKLEALSKSIFIQVDFLKDTYKVPALALKESVIHYEDAISFVTQNRAFARDIVNYFGILHPVMVG